MAGCLNQYWIGVSFIAFCTELIGVDVVEDPFEPAWQRTAISLAIECVKARVLIGGEPDSVWEQAAAIIVENQFFDHYDLNALRGALIHCADAAENTATEVDDVSSARVLLVIHLAVEGLDLAFHGRTPDPDFNDIAEKLISRMDALGKDYSGSARYALKTLKSAVNGPHMERFAAPPGNLPNLLRMLMAQNLSSRASA